MEMLNKNMKKKLANTTTFIRVIMIFISIALLIHNNIALRKLGFIILLFTFLLDGLDGFFARIFNTANNTGALIDTLGDRITENVMLVFLACKNLIPLAIPLIFISRSFFADFIRFLVFSKNIGTFAINKSKFGFYIVASKTSRITYLLLKYIVFLSGSLIIIYQDRKIVDKFSLSLLLFYAVIILTITNILRFLALVFDSRKIIKEIF